MEDGALDGWWRLPDNPGGAIFGRLLSNLLEWSGRVRPRVEWSDDNASASVATVVVGQVAVPGASIDLVLDHSATQSATEATLRQQAMFEVTPSEPVSLSAAMSDYAAS